MPHPFHPDDFPVSEEAAANFTPTKTFYLKGCIHFKKTATILDLTKKLQATGMSFPGSFTSSWADTCGKIASQLTAPASEEEQEKTSDGDGEASTKDQEKAAFVVKSCGNMMRTIKTLHSGGAPGGGDRLADLNITFVSFGSSAVRPAAGQEKRIARHEIEMCPVDDGRTEDSRGGKSKHEAFVRHSVPYFWDLTAGKPYGILYKGVNQMRVEVARVAAYNGGGGGLGGGRMDAILVLDEEQVNDVVALSTCVILLNGRDAMDH